MQRRSFLKSIPIGLVAVTSGCALIFSGAKSPEDRDHSRIQWGYLILDILFTGFLGLIIDFATGAIYAQKGSARSNSAHPVQLCEQAAHTLTVSIDTGHSASYLKSHLRTCTTCAHSLRTMAQAPALDIGHILSRPGDILEESVPVELAPEA